MERPVLRDIILGPAVFGDFDAKMFRESVEGASCNKRSPLGPLSRVSSSGIPPKKKTKRPSADDQTWHPQRSEHYVFSGETFGKGATGNVFVAAAPSTTGQSVAIKVLDSVSSVSSDMSSGEVAALQKVARSGHPNICAFIEHYCRHGEHHIVMEACIGGELFDEVMAVGHMSEERAQRLGWNVVSGMTYMHSLGVVHRDLKLENLLLDAPNGNAKICDFGLSHVFKQRPDGSFATNKLTRCCGTTTYMPPEILASMPYDGFLADVWSFGVCLFAMCAGFFPLEIARTCDPLFQQLSIAQQQGISTVETIFGFYERQCPFTPALAELLDGMLQINPRHRISMSGVAKSRWLCPHSCETVKG
tara:strand:+ start:293 stop:1375 length:1083 start_codon:yes stop_codon:yes gene_type:complete